MSGHPVSWLRYVKIFTYQTHSQPVDTDERHPLETLNRITPLKRRQFVTQPDDRQKKAPVLSGAMFMSAKTGAI